jgi:hypothetical protein
VGKTKVVPYTKAVQMVFARGGALDLAMADASIGCWDVSLRIG